MRPLLSRILLPLVFTSIVLTGCASQNETPETDISAANNTPGLTESIAEQNWKAIKIFDQAADAAESTLMISAESMASGSSGCNNYRGPVEIEGASITFGLLATTRKMCEPAVSGQEKAFLEALGSIQRWTRIGDTLQLLDENNSVAIELTVKVIEDSGAT